MKREIILLNLLILSIGCGNPETQVQVEVASPVTVVEVSLNPIEEYVTATGTINAMQDFILTAETAGFYRLEINPVTGKPFVIGNNVKKDQIIIYLDNPEQVNNINIESKKLNLDISQSEHENQKILYDMGGVTLRELTSAEISYINSKYSYENALMQLAKMKVTVPFDGIIADLPYYTPGIKVNAGSTMAHIQNYKNLIMDINLPGKLLGQIKDGQPVRVTNYSLPDKVLPGKITQVSTILDSATRTFKASVEINNPDLLLRPGMFIKAEVIVASADSAVVIPKDIIMSRQNRKLVYVIDSGTALERFITTGLENPDSVQVTNGLNVDDRLVIDGFETLRNRAKVKIIQ